MTQLVDGCAICNGIGQVAAGQACPVCGGTGVATAGQAAQYRQILVDAAVQAATERFAQAGTNAAEGVLRNLAQAAQDAKETTARAGEVLEALVEVRRQVWVAQQAALRVRGAELLVSRAEAAASAVATRMAAPLELPPDPTDPPQGLPPLPPGFGGEIYYLDSLLARQIDVFNLNVAGAGGVLTNPMTTLGDIITAGPAGAVTRLGIGAANQVLTVVSGVPAWANSPAGFANPMTTQFDLIIATTGGTAIRLPVGTVGQVLQVQNVSGPGWVTPGFLVNPMNSAGDIIIGGASGVPARLPVGLSGYVLTVVGGNPAWQASTTGFTNPMTTAGDIIIATAGGAATRLPVGANGQVLQVTGGSPAWGVNPALGTPLAGPSPTQPTVFQQPDGSMLVIPLSTYSLVGDDSVWINNAFTQLPTRTQQYGAAAPHTWTYGTVRFQPLQYTCNTTVNLPAMVNLVGHGSGTELRGGTAAMTVVSWHSAFSDGANTTFARHKMAQISGIRIDGSGVTGAGIGLDCGDGFGGTIDATCAIVNFRGTGAIGLHLNSASQFTEKWNIICSVMGCTTGCVIEQTGGTNSMEYNDILLWLENNGAMVNGVVVQGGVFLQGGNLTIEGNMGGSAGACLTVTGNDGAGHNTNITSNGLTVNMEATTPSTTTTIALGSSLNAIQKCTGRLSFRFTTFNTALNVTSSNFSYGGLIEGDSVLLGAATGVSGASGRAPATQPVGWA